jgi:Amidohydrolase family
LAIEHVSLLPMTRGGGVQQDMTVILRAGRIDSISTAADAKIPAEAQRINGRGKWLMPALADCHVHSQNLRTAPISPSDQDLSAAVSQENADIFLPYVANGVLQIVNFSASHEALKLGPEVESGRLLAPHMAFCGLIDGFPPVRPTSRVAKTPAEGRAYVREIKASGYDFVKVYTRLTLETFTAIVDEARQENIRVVGHLPERGKGELEQMLIPGFTMVAHAEELAYQVPDYLTKGITPDFIPHFVELAKRNGTGLVSTLTVQQRILEEVAHPETLENRPEVRYLIPAIATYWLRANPYVPRAKDKVWVARIASVGTFGPAVVRAFSDAGILVVPGTDAPLPGVMPGFSLHDELELLAKAGMTNEQVLVAATRSAAEWLRVANDRGTIERGKRADLLLLDGDPLADVANTRKISAVFAGPRYLPRATLDAMMEDLARRNAAAKQQPEELPKPKSQFHFDS